MSNFKFAKEESDAVDARNEVIAEGKKKKALPTEPKNNQSKNQCSLKLDDRAARQQAKRHTVDFLKV